MKKRQQVNPALLVEFNLSVKKNGVRSPLFLWENDEGVIVGIAGWLRSQALKKSKRTTADVYLYKGLTTLTALDILLEENEQRQELSDYDEAQLLGRYVKAGIEQQAIALRINKSPSYVSLKLKLLSFFSCLL